MPLRILLKLAVCALIVSFLGVEGRSQGLLPPQDRFDNRIPSRAGSFIDTTYESAADEIAMANDALQRSSNDAVRSFAATLRNTNIQIIARLRGCACPGVSLCGCEAVPEGDTAQIGRHKPSAATTPVCCNLITAYSLHFDKQYLDAVIDDQVGLLWSLQSVAHGPYHQLARDAAGRPTVSDSPRNVEVNLDFGQGRVNAALARELLPIVRQHLLEAERLRNSL